MKQRATRVRAAEPGDAATLAIGAMLLLADSGARIERLAQIAGMFTDVETNQTAVLEHLEEGRIDGRQVFVRERDDDALVYDFEAIDATRRDVVLALIARALELRGHGRERIESVGDEKRARELAGAIGFAVAS